jgi:transcriptional regulator with XRE-family HTH domain
MGRAVDQAAVGRQLRSARAAAGRTVASVAQDAGLSVPYIANLENGRGNPTLTALSRLAGALGLDLAVTVGQPGDEEQAAQDPGRLPASLVRLGRTRRFRRVVQVMAEAAGRDEAELSVQLVGALAALADVVPRDLAESDWWRLLDALLLIAAYPQGDG